MSTPASGRFGWSRGFALVAVLLLIAVPAMSDPGQSFAVSRSWPMRAADSSRGGASAVSGPATADLAWTFDLKTNNNVALVGPIVAPDGTIYAPVAIGGFQGNQGKSGVYAIRPDGSQKWFVESVPFGTPAIGSDGSVLVVENRGTFPVVPVGKAVVARDPATGAVRWEYFVPGSGTPLTELSSLAVGPDGTIYIGNNTFTLGGTPPSLFAINPNGTLKWKFDRPAQFGCTRGMNSPAVGPSGVVYVNSGCAFSEGALFALSSSGQLLWQNVFGRGNDTDLGAGAGPSINPDGTIYVGNNLAAYDTSGAIQWVLAFEQSFQTASMTGDGALLFYGACPGTGMFCAIDRRGFVRWLFTDAIGNNIDGPAAIAGNGIVYFSATTAGLFALRVADGQLLWKYNTGGSGSPPALGPDGSLYAYGFSPQGLLTLYAFRPSNTSVPPAPVTNLIVTNRRVAPTFGSQTAVEVTVTNAGQQVATNVEIAVQYFTPQVGSIPFLGNGQISRGACE